MHELWKKRGRNTIRYTLSRSDKNEDLRPAYCNLRTMMFDGQSFPMPSDIPHNIFSSYENTKYELTPINNETKGMIIEFARDLSYIIFIVEKNSRLENKLAKCFNGKYFESKQK